MLDEWPVTDGVFNRFTTVASWRGAYAPVEHDGRTYGLKVHEFRKVVEQGNVSALLEELLARGASETDDGQRQR